MSFLLFAVVTWAVNGDNKRPVDGSGVPPGDVVPSQIMALLTEIHYLFIQSPLDINRVF